MQQTPRCSTILTLVCGVDNLASSAIVSAAKITPIGRSIIDLAFALLAFEETDHQYSHEASDVIVITVKAITTSNSIPTTPYHKGIRNTRNSSTLVKSLSYFTVWATDRRVYRSALQHFYSRTKNYRGSPQYITAICLEQRPTQSTNLPNPRHIRLRNRRQRQ